MDFRPINLLEISSWTIKRWISTGGTREKFFCQNPDNQIEYFFKESLKKEGKEYRFEFWSEIIASKLGQILGFNVVDYNVGVYEDRIGCICESILNLPNLESLVEGVHYLIAKESKLIPELNKDKKASQFYTFDLIEKAFEFHGLELFLENIIEIAVFDTIIGNQDRHQENWAFILASEDVRIKRKKTFLSIITKSKESKWVVSYFSIFINSMVLLFFTIAFLITVLMLPYILFILVRNLVQKIFLPKSMWESVDLKRRIKKKYNKYFRPITDNLVEKTKIYDFAPIYDSGSSLGREIVDESKISQMLKNSEQMNAYINRGKSEIRWDISPKQLSHYELLEKIHSKYPIVIQKIIKRVIENYDKQKVKEMIENIDNQILSNFLTYKLSDLRKEFIFKLVDLRIEKLRVFLN